MLIALNHQDEQHVYTARLNASSRLVNPIKHHKKDVSRYSPFFARLFVVLRRMFSLLPVTCLFLLSTVINALPAKANGMCQLKAAQKPVSVLPSGSNGPGNGTNDEFVAMSWYAGWHASDNPPQNISWDKYTQVTYAFA